MARRPTNRPPGSASADRGSKPAAGPGAPAGPDPAIPPAAPPPSPAAAASPPPARKRKRSSADHLEPRKFIRSSVISDAFRDPGSPERRQRLGLPKKADEQTQVMIELNLQFASGLAGAEAGFRALFARVLPDKSFDRITNSYYRCRMSLDEAKQLVQADQGGSDRNSPKERCIYRIWPDFRITTLIDRSIATVKADAALRAYSAAGTGITWAVIDSGIDQDHPHFATYDTLWGDVAELHRDFTQPDISPDLPEDQRAEELKKRIEGALEDELGHGTHVAGIIAGGILDVEHLKGKVKDRLKGKTALTVRVGLTADTSDKQLVGVERRQVDDPRLLSGVAPRAKLVSLKVLGANSGDTSSNVLRALRYVRENVNGEGKLQRIHGVNLSVGYEFDARWFACGQSPICVEVDRLVRSGVVVVVAAGNTGYGELTSKEGITSAGLTLTINDPGNADLAITVGATHRDMPHTYGVSYFSSKGPTGDGRLKPDLVAPGERITSCAAGRRLDEMTELLGGVNPDEAAAPYIDDSGTSMAAPHVSGAAAAFLSIRNEFIGRPEEVKRIFLETATSLRRERYFEGRGLVDLMRAIQSV
jgi:serine protease AprX